MVKVREKSAALGMGSGKAEELSALSKAVDAECIIFDRDLSPTQQRNWETTYRKILPRPPGVI